MTLRPISRPFAFTALSGLASAGFAAQGDGGMTGEVSLGWREVSVSGDRAKYRQHLNLEDGPRLFDLALSWHADDDEDPQGDLSPDQVVLRLSDLGGDPYEQARLEVRRSGRYRFTYQRQESEYFYDDILVLPENASVEGSTGGDFRRFDFERVRDRADLSVELSPAATLQLGFDRYRKRGDGTTVMEVEREEFELERPIDETMQSAHAGISYAWDRVTVAFTERYRSFDFASSAFLAGVSEGSDPEAPTRLERFFLAQPYELDSWEHELRVRAHPTRRLRLSLNVVQADVDVGLDASERSQGTDFTGAPFARDATGVGDIDQDRALYDAGADYALNERVNLFAGLQTAELEQSAASSFEEPAGSDWEIDTFRAEAGAEAAVTRTLRVAGGITRERRDVSLAERAATSTEEEGVDTDADGYFVRLSWRPSTRADLRVTVEDDSIDDPFTLASPTDSTRYRLRGQYRWDNGVTASAGYRRTDRENGNSGWHSDSEHIDLRAGYTGERLTLAAGASRVDLSRTVDSLVLAGTRQVLFAIDYGAEADVLDVAATWRWSPRLSLGGSVRRYDNRGSFSVDRDDVRLFVNGVVGEAYHWGLEYRQVDFAEGGLEEFDADLVEARFGIAW